MLKQFKDVYDTLKDGEAKNKVMKMYYGSRPIDMIHDELLFINSKSRGIIPLKINKVQRRLLKVILRMMKENKPVRICIPKSRRAGISTFLEALGFVLTLTIEGYQTLIVAHNSVRASGLFDMAKLINRMIPEALKEEILHNNAKTLSFKEMNSRYLVIPSKRIVETRGDLLHYVHASEVAYFNLTEKEYAAMRAGVPDTPNTFVFLESTGNGVGDWFYHECMKADRGETDYEVFFVAWHEDEDNVAPVREGFEPKSSGEYGDEVYYRDEFNLTDEQLQWRRNTIRNKVSGDLVMFMQEYPATLEECFQASGHPVFDHIKLNAIEKIYTEPPEYGAILMDGKVAKMPDSIHNPIKIWKKPVSGWVWRYVIFADTGGMWEDADYSAATVYDRVAKEVVATVHGHFAPNEYAEMLFALGHWYDKAKVAIESNRYESETDEQGISVIAGIRKKFKYPNLYMRHNIDEKTHKTSSRIGFHMNRESKQRLVLRLVEMVNEYEGENVFVNDKDIVAEMRTYIIGKTSGGRTMWQAQENCKDDRVMSFGGALLVSDEMPVPKKREGENDERERIKQSGKLLDGLFW